MRSPLPPYSLGFDETPLTYGSPADLYLSPNFLELADERGTAPSPMERYWVEPQRHERIAVMMTGKGPDPASSMPSSSTTAPSHIQHAKTKPSSSNDRDLDNDAVHPKAGRASNHPRRSPSPGFFPGLVIDVDAEVIDDEPDLEGIKIAARIKLVYFFPFRNLIESSWSRCALRMHIG